MINLRKLAIGGIVIILVVIGAFAASDNVLTNNNDTTMVITYGETTYNNQQYKSIVDDYFSQNANVILENVTTEVITANEVNQISQGISNKTYDSNQIFSSALVDLNGTGNLTVNVDTSKITLVTEEMYASALNSTGINQGYVVVTSPISATGESALAGIMSCYEEATNKHIPDEVKKAANDEIYAQSEVVNSSNASPHQISGLVSEVKEEVAQNNTTDIGAIADAVEQTASNNGIELSQADIDKLAEAILQTQSVKDQANDYKNQVTNVINNGGNGFNIFNIFNF